MGGGDLTPAVINNPVSGLPGGGGPVGAQKCQIGTFFLQFYDVLFWGDVLGKVGGSGPSGVVMRLEDIDENGNWKRTHSVQYGDRVVPRRAGETSRGVLREWRKLRDSYGVEGKKQFKSLRVWGNPLHGPTVSCSPGSAT